MSDEEVATMREIVAQRLGLKHGWIAKVYPSAEGETQGLSDDEIARGLRALAKTHAR